MKKTSKPQNKKTFIKGILRRASYQWKARNQALVNARVSRGLYLCASCAELFKPGEVELDHNDPVIDPKMGFTTWDSYIERLFCETEGFSVLCKQCHLNKTLVEDEMRNHYKTERDELKEHSKKGKKREKKSDVEDN